MAWGCQGASIPTSEVFMSRGNVSLTPTGRQRVPPASWTTDGRCAGLLNVMACRSLRPSVGRAAIASRARRGWGTGDRACSCEWAPRRSGCRCWHGPVEPRRPPSARGLQSPETSWKRGLDSPNGRGQRVPGYSRRSRLRTSAHRQHAVDAGAHPCGVKLCVVGPGRRS